MSELQTLYPTGRFIYDPSTNELEVADRATHLPLFTKARPGDVGIIKTRKKTGLNWVMRLQSTHDAPTNSSQDHGFIENCILDGALIDGMLLNASDLDSLAGAGVNLAIDVQNIESGLQAYLVEIAMPASDEAGNEMAEKARALPGFIDFAFDVDSICGICVEDEMNHEVVAFKLEWG